jgi:hypothetical protein
MKSINRSGDRWYCLRAEFLEEERKLEVEREGGWKRREGGRKKERAGRIRRVVANLKLCEHNQTAFSKTPVSSGLRAMTLPPVVL